MLEGWQLEIGGSKKVADHFTGPELFAMRCGVSEHRLRGQRPGSLVSMQPQMRSFVTFVGVPKE